MISVPFELEWVEFGILIPAIPLPEKSQKECGLRLEFYFHHLVIKPHNELPGK